MQVHDDRHTRPAASAAIRPEDMLEDGQNVRVINGVSVRKGTLGASPFQRARGRSSGPRESTDDHG
jgi:hypothetical protein